MRSPTMTTMEARCLLSIAVCAFAHACVADVEGLDDSTSDERTMRVGLTTVALGPAGSIGVIMDVNSICPSWSERIDLPVDNEWDDNRTSSSGWVGDTERRDGHVTLFHFCRVGGAGFRPVFSNQIAANYAVLQLGPTCPSGATSFTRYFDSEDEGGVNSTWSFYDNGDYTPSTYSGATNEGNLSMKLCMFRSSTAIGSTAPFPAIGIRYGVFAGAGVPSVLPRGSWYTDDEDDDNRNSLSGDYAGSEAFLTPGKNTRLYMSRVR